LPISSWRDGASVCLQVLDEGEGIPAADLERSFFGGYNRGSFAG